MKSCVARIDLSLEIFLIGFSKWLPLALVYFFAVLKFCWLCTSRLYLILKSFASWWRFWSFHWVRFSCWHPSLTLNSVLGSAQLPRNMEEMHWMCSSAYSLAPKSSISYDSSQLDNKSRALSVILEIFQICLDHWSIVPEIQNIRSQGTSLWFWKYVW